MHLFSIFILSFNTQPPEGGCDFWVIPKSLIDCFNTQPPEGGCNVDNLN